MGFDDVGPKIEGNLDRIEILGDNCEIGNLLVAKGYVGGGIFRFVFNPTESVLSALKDNLSNIFRLENLSSLPWGMVADSAYNMHFHTEMLKNRDENDHPIFNKDDSETRLIYSSEHRKYEYLKEKFITKSRSGEAVYLIKSNNGIAPELLDNIENELSRISMDAPFLLVEVRQASGDNQSGTIERTAARRAVGWIREFADYSTATLIPDMDGWSKVITGALAIKI